MKNLLFTLVLVSIGGCSVFGIRTTEQLSYDVLKQDGTFELRQYDDYWVVRVELDGSYETATSKGFRLLFNYIDGQNRRQEKISMTGPVIQQSGEKLAMTSPVFQQDRGQKWRMEFVLPEKYNEIKPPEPVSDQVRLIRVNGYKAAVLSYSGNLGEERYRKKIQQLLEIVETRGLTTKGEPFSAGYDPPWTLPFLKRNEVIVAIE